MVLWRMISVGYEADTKIFGSLEFPRFEDVLTDGLDILGGRGDVAALTTRTVLDKDEIAEKMSLKESVVGM